MNEFLGVFVFVTGYVCRFLVLPHGTAKSPAHSYRSHVVTSLLAPHRCNASGGDHWKMGAALFMALQCFDGTFNPAAQVRSRKFAGWQLY